MLFLRFSDFVHMTDYNFRGCRHVAIVLKFYLISNELISVILNMLYLIWYSFMLKITRIHYSRYFFFVYLYTGANLLQIVGIEKGGVFFSYMMHKDTLKNMEM